MTGAKSLFQNAKIICPERELSADDQEWEAHTSFTGVWMKHLILGKDTGGGLSCHLVRVEKGSSIGEHAHEGSLELHEVLSGEGVCRLEGREIAYAPGVCLVMPAGVRHEVAAEGGDLYMMARFTPALM
ncbi:MAG: cupin domain-containing protein [Thermodesulfobacteriota bacterium]